jgi:hypothetical protein
VLAYVFIQSSVHHVVMHNLDLGLFIHSLFCHPPSFAVLDDTSLRSGETSCACFYFFEFI